MANALNTSPQGPIKLYTVADLHEGQIELSLRTLQEKYADKIDVFPGSNFWKFEAY
ncbi:MAG: hypothetical protein R3C12_06425 [Planctomycetaceae bacterium]